MKLTVSMSRREILLGAGYLVFELFFMAPLLMLGNYLLHGLFTLTELNLIFFGLNFLAVLVIFRRFLKNSLDAAVHAPWRCLRYAFFGLVLYWVSAWLVGLVILRLKPDFVNMNDSSLVGMVQEHQMLLTAATVFLVPVTEECLFRGLFFLGLHRKSRLLAYGVSALVFAAVHVAGYIGTVSPAVLVLSLLQYLPAGLCLGWAYEKTDTIFAPILMHMTINQLGIYAMR